jgi:hypothetical protein
MSLNDATSQHIDLYGKCRILNFDGVSIATSPLPPLNVPEVPKSDTHLSTVENALEFMKNTNLEIVEQDIDVPTQLIKGFWVRSVTKPPELVFGYIPIEDDVGEFKEYPISHETIIDPIYVESESYLQIARTNEKIAEYLKEYSIYEWAQKPSKFSIKRNFVVIEDHEYDLNKVNYRMERNDVFYENEKIIVSDIETAKKLVSFVSISALNDSSLERRYKDKKSVNVSAFFKYVTDFESENDQLVFMGKGSLVAWLARDADNIFNVSQQLLPNTKYSYYYRNMSIENGRLMLLQNTKDEDFASALAVSKEWEHTKTNIGYNPVNIFVEENPSFQVYTKEGLSHQSDKKSKFVYKLFGYDDGCYAALLFL